MELQKASYSHPLPCPNDKCLFCCALEPISVRQCGDCGHFKRQSWQQAEKSAVSQQLMPSWTSSVRTNAEWYQNRIAKVNIAQCGCFLRDSWGRHLRSQCTMASFPRVSSRSIRTLTDRKICCCIYAEISLKPDKLAWTCHSTRVFQPNRPSLSVSLSGTDLTTARFAGNVKESPQQNWRILLWSGLGIYGSHKACSSFWAILHIRYPRQAH